MAQMIQDIHGVDFPMATWTSEAEKRLGVTAPKDWPLKGLHLTPNFYQTIADLVDRLAGADRRGQRGEAKKQQKALEAVVSATFGLWSSIDLVRISRATSDKPAEGFTSDSIFWVDLFPAKKLTENAHVTVYVRPSPFLRDGPRVRIHLPTSDLATKPEVALGQWLTELLPEAEVVALW